VRVLFPAGDAPGDPQMIDIAALHIIMMVLSVSMPPQEMRLVIPNCLIDFTALHVIMMVFCCFNAPAGDASGDP
jgi:hypothetical protein